MSKEERKAWAQANGVGYEQFAPTGTGRELKIEIDTTAMEKLVERAKKAENDQEGFKILTKDLAKSMQEQGISIDSQDITKDNFKENVHRLYEAEAKTKEVLAELEGRDFSGVGEGSSGRSSLQNGEQGGKKTFNSQKEMIDHLTELEIEQNPSNNPESDSEAKKTKDALWQKYVNALKQRKIHQPVQYLPEDEKSDTPIIGKYIQNVNKRKKALTKGEK